MRVARALSGDHMAVAAAPFAETAWAHLQLLEAERLEGFARDAESLQQASRMVMAFHEPKALKGERDALRSRMLAAELEDAGVDDVRAARARGLALAARLQAKGVMVS